MKFEYLLMKRKTLRTETRFKVKGQNPKSNIQNPGRSPEFLNIGFWVLEFGLYNFNALQTDTCHNFLVKSLYHAPRFLKDHLQYELVILFFD